MGEEADGILCLFGLSDDNRKKYNTSPRLTLLSEETLSTNKEVYMHRREEGELVDSFITSLYRLAE